MISITNLIIKILLMACIILCGYDFVDKKVFNDKLNYLWGLAIGMITLAVGALINFD